MAIISNGTTILDAGSFSVGLGALTFIKDITVSGAKTQPYYTFLVVLFLTDISCLSNKIYKCLF